MLYYKAFEKDGAKEEEPTPKIAILDGYGREHTVVRGFKNRWTMLKRCVTMRPEA